jgi:hypothetical protein
LNPNFCHTDNPPVNDIKVQGTESE